MPRLQVLELPMEHHGDDTITPYLLILDDLTPEQLPAWSDQDEFHRIAELTGARAVLALPFKVDIPANQVTLEDGQTYPVTLKVEGDFSKFDEQVEDAVRRMQDKTALRGLA